MHLTSAGSGFLRLSAPISEWRRPPPADFVWLRGYGVAGGRAAGRRKVEERFFFFFFFRRRVRSGALRVRPGLPGGAGPAGEGPRSSSGNQTSAIRGCTATCNSLFTAAE